MFVTQEISGVSVVSGFTQEPFWGVRFLFFIFFTQELFVV